MRNPLLAFAAAVTLFGSASGQTGTAGLVETNSIDSDQPVPSLPALVERVESELADVVLRYSADRYALGRRWDVQYSPTRNARFREFFEDWEEGLEEVDFESLSIEGKIDYVLLQNELRYRLESLDRDDLMFEEMLPLIPFASSLLEMMEARRRMEIPNPRETAAALTDLVDQISNAEQEITDLLFTPETPARIVGFRASNALQSIRRGMRRWFSYFDGYNPQFSWWVEAPYNALDNALNDHIQFLRSQVVGIVPGQEEPIVGDPIGEDGLRSDLAHDMIPYSATELIEIAEREFEWLEEQLIQASRDLGFGDDWRAAQEHVKNLAVDPGEQTNEIRYLAFEAIDFVKERDLLTVPALAEEIWRMEMMSPEQQKVSPFFLGGEVIRVSYPTDEMEHADKLMSMRGNNPHFSRATVHHELIPGHHLQGFMTSRYNSHRRAFSTPFWTEGWPLHWEMLLWDLDFPRGPEDRIGMLFWRMHRVARIIFSLSFHLEEMTPDEAIDFLVDRVGHERANATAEVRRSFNGSYPPLYQAAYMLGGMQVRALYQEYVESGTLTAREFHDFYLQGGPMPIEMLRARLRGEPPAKDFEASWRFAN